MERLTKWVGESEYRQAIPRSDIRFNNHNRCCNKLAEYEDAEEQGLLLKLPCRVRDAVYVIVGKDVSRQRVNEIRILPGSVKFETSTGRIFDKGAFGDNVFLTRKDAMEKLEKMKK